MKANGGVVGVHLPDLRSRALTGFAWSMLEGWGSRGIAFITSLVLARFLSPELFGISAAVAVVFAVIPLVADLGFNDALIQRRPLRDEDVTIPFVIATALGLVATALIVIFAEPICGWLGIGNHESFLIAVACTVPLSIPLAFQDAMYRRHLKFRVLAIRSFLATMLGGIAGIACAVAGFGLWTFVVQAWLGAAIMATWLFWRPLWKPTWRFAPQTVVPLLRFGLPTLAMRIVDFVSTRLIDILIVTQVGLVAYGLFALGSRLYQTLLQLLQGAFSKVAFTLLAKISDDRSRIVNAYEETVSIAASAISPVFVLLALVAPELADVLFDERWAAIADIMRPLLLLGAIHAVQYMNGSFLAASGQPGKSLITGLVRSGFIIAALLLVRRPDAVGITWTFVLASLAASPLSFHVVTQVIGASRKTLVCAVSGPWLCAAAAFFVAEGMRAPMLDAIDGPVARGLAIGAVFVATYAAALHLFALPGARRIHRYVGDLRAAVRNRFAHGAI